MNPEIIIISIIILIAIVLLVLLVMIRSRKKPKSNSLESGAVFDSFEINRFIKRGGMASVFEATNVKTKEIVALKIMHESLIDDDDLVEKFLREGDILEKLNRKFPEAPIVKVFRHSRENNETNGRPFIALELVKGVDLDAYLINEKPTVNQSIEIIEKILFALKAAHSEGILHRDISPGNVMIELINGELKQVKMIDFGVAKNEYMNKNTPDSSIHGKPPFMSPEQCRNEKLDKRSDIYSLGILFYTLLVGQPPFISKNPLEVMSMHQTNEYPPLPSGISKPIRNIVQNLLEKDIISRYQNADEVLMDLRKENKSFNNETSAGIQIENENKYELVEDVSNVYNLDHAAIVEKKGNSIFKKSISLIGILLLLVLVVSYFAINEFQPKAQIIIARKYDPLTKVLSELRKYDVKINYQFADTENYNGNIKTAFILKPFVINSASLEKNKYITILVGSKNDE